MTAEDQAPPPQPADCAPADCAPPDCTPADCAPADCTPADCASTDCAPGDCYAPWRRRRWRRLLRNDPDPPPAAAAAGPAFSRLRRLMTPPTAGQGHAERAARNGGAREDGRGGRTGRNDVDRAQRRADMGDQDVNAGNPRRKKTGKDSVSGGAFRSGRETRAARGGFGVRMSSISSICSFSSVSSGFEDGDELPSEDETERTVYEKDVPVAGAQQTSGRPAPQENGPDEIRLEEKQIEMSGDERDLQTYEKESHDARDEEEVWHSLPSTRQEEAHHSRTGSASSKGEGSSNEAEDSSSKTEDEENSSDTENETSSDEDSSETTDEGSSETTEDDATLGEDGVPLGYDDVRRVDRPESIRLDQDEALQDREALNAVLDDFWASQTSQSAGVNDGEALFEKMREREYDEWLERLEKRNEKIRAMLAPPPAEEETEATVAPLSADRRTIDPGGGKMEGESLCELSLCNGHKSDETEKKKLGSESLSGGDIKDVEYITSADNHTMKRCIANKGSSDLRNHEGKGKPFSTTVVYESVVNKSRYCKDNMTKNKLQDCTDLQTSTFGSTTTRCKFTNDEHYHEELRRPEPPGSVPRLCITTPDQDLTVDVLASSPAGEGTSPSPPYEVWDRCFSKVYYPARGHNRLRPAGETNHDNGDGEKPVTMVKDSLSLVKDFVARIKESPFYASGVPSKVSSHAFKVKDPPPSKPEAPSRRNGIVTFQSALNFFREQARETPTANMAAQVRTLASSSSAEASPPSWMRPSRKPASPSYFPAFRSAPKLAAPSSSSSGFRRAMAHSWRVAGSAVSASLERPAEGAPRRSPSHYANPVGFVPTHQPPPAPAYDVTHASDVIPTCERLEREREAREREQGRVSGGGGSSRAFQQPRGDLSGGADRREDKEAVLSELRAVRSGEAPRPGRPAAVPSRSFRLLQQEYGSAEPEPEPEPAGRSRPEPQEPEPELQKRRMAASSKTYRMLQADPAAVPSVFGRNRR